ncbi:YgfZ/GcvT domain-containing protein [Primorskyibacter flagellatus]|uniref:CAF17-like 4Fe-4S cluster assembly/insertion protein YgfZ n=1 Tax=Primorskyibacter flagellatus TaxID=1387277 RepID=UPI003A90A2E7
MDRTVIRVSGGEARHFLQGLVTNDIEKLDQGLVYAAILTPQGKYLADFFLAPDGEEVLIDVDASLADALFQRLSMYKLRSPVTLTREDMVVTCGTGPVPEGAYADPRDPSMGWRAYGPGFEATPTDWDALRVAACIPQTGVELGPDTFILEAGFDRLNGVDFRKGCYVGQEVTARMRHKTELRKGFALVEVDGDADPGAEITTAEGKPAGTLHTRSGDKAIAYLRFDRARDEMKAGDATLRRL